MSVSVALTDLLLFICMATAPANWARMCASTTNVIINVSGDDDVEPFGSDFGTTA